MPLDSAPATVRRPRRVIARTLGFGFSALLAAGLLAWSPGSTTGWNQGSAEATLWQLMNGARSNNGMAPVQQHGTLVSLARWRSQDMLNKNYFSHTIAGCGCLVYVYYDSNGLSYQWAGENIGWNSGLDDSYSPVRVHEKFMESPGHRANVLDRRFTHGGVGAAAADNKMFQGYVQNTRMYTELFLQAAGSYRTSAERWWWRRRWWRRWLGWWRWWRWRIRGATCPGRRIGRAEAERAQGRDTDPSDVVCRDRRPRDAGPRAAPGRRCRTARGR